MREFERVILLRVVDENWMEHIDAMDDLRQGVRLRAYGNVKPIDAYKNESFEMVRDEFGKDIVYIKHDDEHFRILCDSIISEGLTSYLVQFADKIEVLSPPKLRRMVIEKIDRLCEVYKK